MIKYCRLLGSYGFSRISAVSVECQRSNVPLAVPAAARLKHYRSPFKYESRRRTLNEVKDELLLGAGEEGTEVGGFGEEHVDRLLDRALLRFDSGHQVFVIQPYIKFGPKRKTNTTPELQLLEAVTLIKTLREWKVVAEAVVSLLSLDRKYLFGKGNLSTVKEIVEKCPQISAIFVSVDTLSLAQQLALQEEFGVPVFDRYTIIMHIFREHATSKEAKLQIKLAELPYLWKMLRGFNFGIGEKFGGDGKYMGGVQPRWLDSRKEIFKAKEGKIRREIQMLREQRRSERQARGKKDMPVVAVVGYTNAGKTSVIKALTEKDSLEPQDYLFATLDVTCHIGQLPSNLSVYFVDTLGFISDIPTYLIESFVTTLEDALNADLIIHIRDVSHPDTVAQNDNVIQTLEQFNLLEETRNNIITVGNKVDKLSEDDRRALRDDDGMILVSCTELTGIDVLRHEIEKKILELTGRREMVIRLESGSEEYDWLHENAAVVSETPDPKNNQFMLVKVIISQISLDKFKHKFIKSHKSR